jgi:hypothetical protein
MASQRVRTPLWSSSEEASLNEPLRLRAAMRKAGTSIRACVSRVLSEAMFSIDDSTFPGVATSHSLIVSMTSR